MNISNYFNQLRHLAKVYKEKKKKYKFECLKNHMMGMISMRLF